MKTRNQLKSLPRVTITGDSLSSGINEKGLWSKDNRVKTKKIPGGTTETILEEVKELVKNKPDTLIVHAGTNDFTKGKNVLNNVKKIIKSVKRFSPQTKLAFSSMIFRKDKKNIDKEVLDTNAGLRDFCNRKNIDYIDNTNIKGDHLCIKKLHLNKRGACTKSALAPNLLRYLRSKYWENDIWWI